VRIQAGDLPQCPDNSPCLDADADGQLPDSSSS
jgi:hypothetical protein